MNPKGRHLVTAGVLFSALAFSGASFAQSSASSTSSSDHATTAQSTKGAMQTPPSTSNRDAASSNASSNTATPSGSAMSDNSSTRASSSANRAQASTNASDNARSAVSANAITEAHAMRASKIIGADVENANGDEIGEIKDMMVDTRNERVRYVVLSHGGVLGIGDKLFAYPMSMVETKGTNSDKLVMNVNKEKLDKAPGFDKKNWPDFANGDEIGEIKDMMVDTRNERVRYVVLSHGGVLGIGDKLFAYPMSMVETKGTNSDKLVMNVNKEKLDKAPGFDKKSWPDFASNSKYSGEVDKYYGASSRHDGQQAGNLVRASDLIGKNFDDTKGKEAGEIEDLIVDSNSGNVEYAIVDFDDSWAKSTDGKLVAIPLSNITVSGDKNDKLVIQTSADRIDMSHAFASNHWPDFSNPAWAQQRESAAAQSQGTSTAPTSQSRSSAPTSQRSSTASPRS